MSTNSEREHGKNEFVSHAYLCREANKYSPVVQESASETSNRSSSRRLVRTHKNTAEKGIGTEGPRAKVIPAPAVTTPRPIKQASSSPTGCPSATVAGSGAGDDTEDEADETLVDTESDASLPPTREVSFAFSTFESGNASMTSVSSSDSFDSTTGRKRTLGYVNTWNTPIVNVSASLNSARAAHKTVATPPPQSDPTHASDPAKASSSSSSVPSQSKVDMPAPTHDLESSPAVDSSTLWPNVFILAHDKEAQRLFDAIPLSWGVQYELARGVALGYWSWDRITKSDLAALGGPNNNAVARVPQVILGRALNSAAPPDMALWSELDREEAAICEGRLRGLGMQGEWKGEPKWYGGHIQQVARLEEDDDKSFRLVLSKMEMRKSHRFARFLGSRRLLQVSVPKPIVNSRGEDLRAFFSKKFVLCGRVFVAFGAKDSKIFLMETPEEYQRAARVPGDGQRITLEDFVAWHNPLSLNGNQPTSKWATRFDLGFSISVPAIVFPKADVEYIGDEHAPHDESKKVPTECIYTDGCGMMNRAALNAIARHMGHEERPTAVQGRIAGAKGLWILHPSDSSPTPKIWIRDSQVKIKLDHSNLHRAHQIFDLVAPPRVTLPSRLSRLTILNLAHNGVPTETFVELMKETLDAAVQPLTQWTGPQAMLLLWKEVDRVGGVSIKRALQHTLGITRALGLTGRIREDETNGQESQEDELTEILEELAEVVGELEDGEDIPASYMSLRDQTTGEPLTVHGVVLDLLQAGFHPLKLGPLYQKLRRIVAYRIEDIIRDFHVSIPLSAEAFIIPDPCGVLKEGEIHFKSLQNLKDPLEDTNPRTLLGDVLVYRNPNRLPSDVQKVKAVQCDALSDYTDVIVFPTVGRYSFASYLAGGDYDGDVAVVIYDPRLVVPFRTSPLTRQPDDLLEKNFEDQGKIQQVSEMAQELASTHDRDARRKKLQQSLLIGLSTAPVGLYSMFHENAVYSQGYDAPETIRNAFMFNIILDSRKTGYRVLQSVLKKDKSKYDRKRPEFLGSSSAAQQNGNFFKLKRERDLGQFILEHLYNEGLKLQGAQLERYDNLCKPIPGDHDADLLRPYEIARMYANGRAEDGKYALVQKVVEAELACVKDHVDNHIKLWQLLTQEMNPVSPMKRASMWKGKGKGTAASSTKIRRAKYEELARSFAAGPELPANSLLVSIGKPEELRASCAYKERPSLAWRVAFQALCGIKAKACGGVAFTREFAEAMAIPASTARVLERSRQAIGTA